MDLGCYASKAVNLVNGTPSAGTDPSGLASGRGELRRVFEYGAGGDDAAMVAALNRLLTRYPLSPMISDHDHQPWHLHVSNQSPVAEAVFGLALVVTELGPDRFGICAAADCGDVFIDISPNHSRRFCGDRCATRTNVAAYRRRRSVTPSTIRA